MDAFILSIVVGVVFGLSYVIGKATFRIIDVWNTWQFERLMRREAMEANLRG